MGCCSGAEKPPMLTSQRDIVLDSTRLRVVHGNIAEETADIIVNSANINLKHGGEVSGQILQKGSIDVQRDSVKFIKENKGPLNEGDVAKTRPGLLKCKHLLHAVGPIWYGGEKDEEVTLSQTINAVLTEAANLEAKSIAIPAISCGIFMFPKDKAAKVIFDTIVDYLKDNRKTQIEEIKITVLDVPTMKQFVKEFDLRYPEEIPKLKLSPKKTQEE